MNTSYLVGGVRTPFGRYDGTLAGVRPDDLAAHALRSLAASFPSVANAARSIRAGDADLVVAGGVESMTRAPFVIAKAIANGRLGREISPISVSPRRGEATHV